jgi:hypothetical protein
VTRSILTVHRDKRYFRASIVEYLKASNCGGKREVWDFYHSTVNTSWSIPRPSYPNLPADKMGAALLMEGKTPGANYPESRVLIIMTGGTICMQPSADGLVPMTGFLESAMAPRPSFNDNSAPPGMSRRTAP